MSDSPTPWTALIRARELRGWSRFHLANRMKMNLSHLGDLERGLVSPRANTVRRAAETLGVPVASISPRPMSSDDGNVVVRMDQIEALVQRLVAEELDRRGLGREAGS